MKVINYKDQRWTLYSENNALFLEAECEHGGGVGYSFLIELSADEIRAYEGNGSTYLDKLSHDIHYSAPSHINSNSEYKSRRASQEFLDRAYDAKELWRVHKTI